MEPDDRLRDLERTQRFHEDVLARHEQHLADHAEQMRVLREIQALQADNLTRLTDIAARLETTLQAIKDILGRGNGH
jgi:hypothetical protein